MKHVERIVFDGENHVYGISAGYCQDIDSYVVRGQSGWVYDYSIYFAINQQEYQKIIDHIEELNENVMTLEQIIPEYHNRYIGASYSRGYDIVPFRYDAARTPFTYRGGPFLCGDGIFYFHLYWQGHHYAAVPRLWNGCIDIGDKRYRTGPYRERPDIGLIKISYDGNEIPLCYGKEVHEFEGAEEWCDFHDQASQ